MPETLLDGPTASLATVSEWHCQGRRSGWQEEFLDHDLIELPLTGMDLRDIRGRQQVLDVGSAVLHVGDEAFAVASPSAQPRRSTSLSIRPELLRQMAPDCAPGVVRLSVRTALLHQRLRTLAFDGLARDELSLMLVDGVLDDARQQTGRREAEARLPPSWRRLAGDLTEHLAQAFEQDQGLEDLARACGASPFHASRVFRRVTGLSLHRHRQQLRLREALYRLPDMRGRLTELALDLGFSSHSHFSAAFKAEYGFSPQSGHGKAWRVDL